MGYFSTKEYTGMNFANLVEPDISLRAAKKQTAFAVNFDLGEYNKKYWNWKHNYRARYSERKLEKFGYEPHIFGQSLEDNIPGMTEYMQQNIDSSYHHAISYKKGIADIYSQLMYHMQINSEYNYNIRDRRLFIGGKQYVYQYTSYLEDDDPYTPDDKSIIVGHFKDYDTLYTTEEYYTVQLPNTFGTDETFENIYARTEEENNYVIYLTNSYNIPPEIFSLDEYVITPVIMLQEFGIPAENSDVHRQMLREFGVRQRDFDETLNATDDDGEINVDNAYMLNALSILNPYIIEAREYQAYEAQNLPSAFLDSLSYESLNGGITREEMEENEVPLDEYSEFISESFYSASDPELVIPTQEECDKWYDRHMKEQAYLARGLFKSFAYYANAINEDILNEEKFSLIYIGNSISDIESEYRGKTPTNFYGDVIKTNDEWKESDVDISVEQSRLKMRYGFDISIETKAGKVRPDVIDKRAQGNIHYSGRMHSVQDPDGDRDYWETDDSEGYDKLVIQVQKNINEYQEMVITNFRADYDLGKHGFAVGPGAPDTMNRLVLPYFVLKEVKFREYVTIADHSFSVFMYSYKKVPFDWASFGIRVVLTLAACLYAGCVGIEYLWAVAEMVVYNIAITYLLDLIDSEILQQMLSFAYQLYQFMQGDFNLADMEAENYLMLASKVSSLGQKAWNLMNYEDSKMELANQKGRENIDSKISSIDDSMQVNPVAIMTAHNSFVDANSTEAFYTQMYGAQLFNFDQFYNVDGEIELRKQVTSG